MLFYRHDILRSDYPRGVLFILNDIRKLKICLFQGIVSIKRLAESDPFKHKPIPTTDMGTDIQRPTFWVSWFSILSYVISLNCFMQFKTKTFLLNNNIDKLSTELKYQKWYQDLLSILAGHSVYKISSTTYIQTKIKRLQWW